MDKVRVKFVFTAVFEKLDGEVALASLEKTAKSIKDVKSLINYERQISFFTGMNN